MINVLESKKRNGWENGNKIKGLENGFQKINGLTYFIKDGNIHKGFLDIEGDMYYFDVEGVLVTASWISSQEGWYYFDSKGKMAVGYRKVGDKYYLFNQAGIMQTGIQEVKKGTHRYFHTTEGYMIRGWIVDEEKVYFANSQGNLHKGYMSNGDTIVHFKEDYTLDINQ